MKPFNLRWLLLVGLAALSVTFVQAGISLGQEALFLQSVEVEGELPVTDPTSDLWGDANEVAVPLSGQTVALPNRPLPFANSVQVRTLHNGTHIVFRVSWPDTTKDNRTTGLHEFRDATALLLASSDLPGICMGSRGQRVHIVQWKADWQADIEEGFHDLQDTFPNFWVDYYPFAVGGPPYQLPEAFPEGARDLLVGWSVGNPFSEPLKVTAVEDAVAEGFGTITTQERQDALGRGVWVNGRWTVTIARQLDTGDPADQPLGIGGRFNFALAIWDGSSSDVGARKSVSSWITLDIPGPPPFAALQVLVPVILIILAAVAALLLIRSTWRRRKRE
jgi:hypothetical protein